MIVESPTLSVCLRGLHDRREQALAGALADTVGVWPDDVMVRTVAGLLGAVHRVLLQPEAALAFDLLEPALGDYAVAS